MEDEDKKLSGQFHSGHMLAMQMADMGLKKAFETDEITWLNLDFDSSEKPKTGSTARSLEARFEGIFWPNLPESKRPIGICAYGAKVIVRLERERPGFRSAWITRSVVVNGRFTQVHNATTIEKIYRCRPLAEGSPSDDELPARTSFFTEFDD